VGATEEQPGGRDVSKNALDWAEQHPSDAREFTDPYVFFFETSKKKKKKKRLKVLPEKGRAPIILTVANLDGPPHDFSPQKKRYNGIQGEETLPLESQSFLYRALRDTGGTRAGGGLRKNISNLSRIKIEV